MKSVNCSKPGYTSVTCSKISCDYLNLSLANEYAGDVTIPIQVIEYNQKFLQAHQPIRLQYSNQIKLFTNNLNTLLFQEKSLVTSDFDARFDGFL